MNSDFKLLRSKFYLEMTGRRLMRVENFIRSLPVYVKVRNMRMYRSISDDLEDMQEKIDDIIQDLEREVGGLCRGK